jgi:hypothetical protein
MLREAPASPVQLAERLPDVTLGAIAYHVRTLHDLDLLELVGTRQKRGATEHVYRAVELPVRTEESWAELGPVAKQRVLSATLQELTEHASSAAAAGGFDRSDAQLMRTALKLDDRGFRDLAATTKKWLKDVERIEAGAKKRAPRNHAPIQAALVMMLFEASRSR